MTCPSTSSSQLENLYQTWQTLRPTSPPSHFAAFGAFFAPTCTACLQSMREWDLPSIGRQAIIDAVKSNIQTSHIEERVVQSLLASDDGRTVVCEMRNRLNVLGYRLENYFETAVVRYDGQGLVSDFRVYGCRSPIVGVVQTVTGRGPYTDAAAKREFELQAPILRMSLRQLKLSVVGMSKRDILPGSFRHSGPVFGRRLIAFFAS
ncbi:hypothetical protein LAWI1_G001643 [Lachnellula willkommii]|uniref:SnoaL-like domain-containing protein n=1 Tax=Lachnellula willkommii TaxID=215461 RepID=A0A559ML30_9HELO|nr:hypothetical protein LAWI1_G001643 [Lachnellula willkommii]